MGGNCVNPVDGGIKKGLEGINDFTYFEKSIVYSENIFLVGITVPST